MGRADGDRLGNASRVGFAGRWARVWPVVVVWLVGCCLLVPALASGAVGRSFLSAVSGAGGEALGEPAAVTVDRSSGDVFVGDALTGYVDVFDASGKYVTRFGEGELSPVGVAVDEAAALVFVAESYEDGLRVFKANGAGEYEQVGEWAGAALPGKGFGEVTGLAVDNSKSASAGDVYVVDSEDPQLSEGVVDVFKPKGAGPEEGAEGTLVRVLSKGKMEEPNGVAIDPSSGKVFVADSLKGAVFKYSPAGVLEGKLTGKGPEGTFAGPEEEEGNVTAVAVDPTSGDLLVAEAERQVISELNPAGEWVGQITSDPQVQFDEPRGVAVSGTGNAYAADGLLGKVDIFGPGVAVPDVATGKATKLARTTAVLPGTLNGESKPGHYFFEYGTTKALGSSTPLTPFAGGEEKPSVTASELRAGTSYYYRLAAENENGTSYGATKEFQTPTAVEGLSTGTVSDLQPTSVMLNGTLSPNGVDAHYLFQWGRTTSYGNETLTEDSGTGTSPMAAKADLTGLTANTVYHYRLVATNSFGITEGTDQSFTTSGPPRITSKPTTGIGHETGALNAEVNPDELETRYHIEYGETESYGTETPVGGASLGNGGKPVPVTAALTSLKLGVTYHYRIIATNSAGETTSPDQTFTTIPPALTTSYASDVTPTTATLGAAINPLGHDTTYYFQYGTATCSTSPASCTDNPAAPGEDIGSGETLATKTLNLTELAPDTTYHYRIIAINSLGTAEGIEHSITTPKPVQPVALPDNRAWELVTPPDKEGAPVEALTREGGIIRASEDGNKLTYVVDGALGGNVQGNRSPEMQQVIATRGPASWSSQDIATPSSKAKGITAGQAPEYQYFTPELSVALDEPAGGEPDPPLAPGVTQATPYVRDNTTGVFTPLLTEANTAPATSFGGRIQFVSASPDLRHIVLKSGVALAGPGSYPGLYEWNEGNLAFVSALPEGAPAHEPELGFQGRVVTDAISSDGSRVVWTNREDLSTRGGHLYLRDTTNGKTLQLDAAQGVAEPSKGSALFQGADPEDSRVFFTDRQKLTPDSTAEPGQGAGKPDLYECEVLETQTGLACHLKDLTVDAVEGEHAALQGTVLGVDASGSTLAVVAHGILTRDPSGSGSGPVAGQDNLYELSQEGSDWRTTFIATLSAGDSPEWEGNSLGDPAFVTARLSPNGRYLAFMSEASLTGYDNVDMNPAAKGARDEEVYLYDAGSASLTCVSCNPTGSRPAGVFDQNESGEGLGLLIDRRRVWAEPGREHWLGGNIPGWTAQSLTSALFQSRYLNDEGRLFFNSPDELVPDAKNHKANVYEYEPSGIGECTSASGGCVALLSSGTSDRESAFVEATPSGDDVFFVTEANLLPQDTDTAFDMYDARSCAPASPCQTAPAPPPGGCDETQSCRPALPPLAPESAAGGSETFVGAGNPSVPVPQLGVKSETASKLATAKPLTKAMRLKLALATCRKRYKHSGKKRIGCERTARKRYGPPAKRSKTSSRGPGATTDAARRRRAEGRKP